MLRAHPGRVRLLHVKDIAAGVPQQFTENVPAAAFKEVGAGSLELKRILHDAVQARVEHFFVEQDQTPGDPLASVKISAAWLKRTDF
jgi:sugar phosphate isomerase/epimerase